MHFRTEIRGKRRTKILSKGGIETKQSELLEIWRHFFCRKIVDFYTLGYVSSLVLVPSKRNEGVVAGSRSCDR